MQVLRNKCKNQSSYSLSTLHQKSLKPSNSLPPCLPCQPKICE